MNNDQFRKLMLAKSSKSPEAASVSPSSTAKPSHGTSLGSRQRASIPMTPRAVGNTQADFARQLAERNQALRPQKKFKTSAPKGVRLAEGYVDRAKEREAADEDDRQERLKALEILFKTEEIDQETFDKQRAQIAGGDLGSTHLVKGLDFALLKRVRAGEDVYDEKAAREAKEDDEESQPEDPDDEFDKLEDRQVQAAAREKSEKKKGQLSTVSLAAGKKRSRDQILAELKASREAAAAKAQQESALGSRFQRIGAKKTPGSRIERDRKGREVLIIIDEDGHEKRKVRKAQPTAADEEENAQDGIQMPDKDAKPLGMEAPEEFRKVEEPVEEEDVDIFDDVGDDYDPLAGMEGSDSDDDEDDKGEKARSERKEVAATEDAEVEDGETTTMPPPPKPPAEARRNYFQDSKTQLLSTTAEKAPDMSDPAIMAAIKRAAALKQKSQRRNSDSGSGSDDDDDAEAKARAERRKKMLQSNDRDEQDMDMGFGTSRFEDEEDFDESRVKLSNWGDDAGDGEGAKGGQKRKRGPKKRKGDGNNAADVLRVMEQRKKG